MRPAAKQYLIEMTVALVLYMTAIFFTGWTARHVEMTQAVRVAVALLPAIPTALVFLAILRFVRRQDELQQRILGESAIISASLVGFSSFAYGLLESYAGLPSIPMVWVLPALFGVHGVAVPFVRRRYQ